MKSFASVVISRAKIRNEYQSQTMFLLKNFWGKRDAYVLKMLLMLSGDAKAIQIYTKLSETYSGQSS